MDLSFSQEEFYLIVDETRKAFPQGRKVNVRQFLEYACERIYQCTISSLQIDLEYRYRASITPDDIKPDFVNAFLSNLALKESAQVRAIFWDATIAYINRDFNLDIDSPLKMPPVTTRFLSEHENKLMGFLDAIGFAPQEEPSLVTRLYLSDIWAKLTRVYEQVITPFMDLSEAINVEGFLPGLVYHTGRARAYYRTLLDVHRVEPATFSRLADTLPLERVRALDQQLTTLLRDDGQAPVCDEVYRCSTEGAHIPKLSALASSLAFSFRNMELFHPDESKEFPPAFFSSPQYLGGKGTFIFPGESFYSWFKPDMQCVLAEARRKNDAPEVSILMERVALLSGTQK